MTYFWAVETKFAQTTHVEPHAARHQFLSYLFIPLIFLRANRSAPVQCPIIDPMGTSQVYMWNESNAKPSIFGVFSSPFLGSRKTQSKTQSFFSFCIPNFQIVMVDY
jgi:hypothetical protein